MAITIDNTDVTNRNIVLETGAARDMSFARPSAAQDDEYCFIAIVTDGGASATISWTATPSDWTQFIDHPSTDSAGRPIIGAWYKKLASGDTGPFVVSYAAAAGSVFNSLGIIQRVQGANASVFEDVADVSSDTSSSVNHTAPTITTSTNDAEVFYLWANNDGRFLVAADSGYPDGTTGMFNRIASSSGSSPTVAMAHKTQASAGAAGTAQMATWLSTPTVGRTVTFAIRAAAVGSTPDITDFGDETHRHGETGVVITGTGFSASGNTVIVSPSDDIDDVNAVEQTITDEGTTSITITTDLDTFDFDADLYLFVTNSGATSNATGFVFQRYAVISITKTLETKAAAAQASVTDINWAVYEDVTLETLLERGTGESTDGSGQLVITLTEQGTLDPNNDDPVYLILSKDGAVGSELFGAVKVVPTYA